MFATLAEEHLKASRVLVEHTLILLFRSRGLTFTLSLARRPACANLEAAHPHQLLIRS